MSYNPSSGSASVDSHNTGAYKYDSQNDVSGSSRQRKNTFDNSRPVIDTFKFGDISPFECVKCVVDDTHRLRNNFHIRSYTMKSPMFGSIKMNKDYYQVPLSSILPRTWELYYRNPQKGDDCPASVYCNMPLSPLPFLKTLQELDLALTSVISSGSFPLVYCLRYLWNMSALYHIYSSQSLPTRLGIATHKMISYSTVVSGRISAGYFPLNEFYTVDDLFDLLLNKVVSGVNSFSIRRINFINRSSSVNTVLRTFDLTVPSEVRDFFDFCFAWFPTDVPINYINFTTTSSSSSVYSFGSVSNFVLFVGSLFGAFPHPAKDVVLSNTITSFDTQYFSATTGLDIAAESAPNGRLVISPYEDSEKNSITYDIAPLVAYQQLCAQFFTVDAIDNLFNSDLWMKNAESILHRISTFGSYAMFDYNGTNVLYDTFSLYYLNGVFNYLGNEESWGDDNCCKFIYNLFGYQNSLLYGDYITGGRLEPLAVGDVTIQVADSNVNIVDISKSGWKTRFLNFVNRFGAQIQDYIRGLFGVTPGQLQPMPKFIAHESTPIAGYEVENTTAGDNSSPTTQQGYSVTLLNSRASNYAFDVYVDTPSWIIGVVSFDMQRFYDCITERQAFCHDRFDEFNPFLQNLGDQAMYTAEINPLTSTPEDPVMYHLRDTEWKQRVPVARGAFVKSYQNLLPAWARVVDLKDFKLDSESIRNKNSDIDEFFMSLSHVSFGNYFHFIAFIYNDLESDRPMQYKPMFKI